MNFTDMLTQRHSCRRFSGVNIEKEKLDFVLKAASSSPSAGNLQAYVVRVVTDPQMTYSLGLAAYGQSFIGEAPAILVFFAMPELAAHKYGDRGMTLYCVQDATIACTYAMLAATEVGLQSCWIGAFEPNALKRILTADWSWIPVSMLPIGYSAKSDLTSPEKFDRIQTYDSTSAHWGSR